MRSPPGSRSRGRDKNTQNRELSFAILFRNSLWKEHLDVRRSKWALAVRLGVREITRRELALMLQERRRKERRGS